MTLHVALPLHAGAMRPLWRPSAYCGGTVFRGHRGRLEFTLQSVAKNKVLWSTISHGSKWPGTGEP